MSSGQGVKRLRDGREKWVGPLPTVLVMGHQIPMSIRAYLDKIVLESDLTTDISNGTLSVPQAFAKALAVSDHFQSIDFVQVEHSPFV